MWLQHNKIINLKIAKQKLNKITIAPGETFSYWKLIGKPTKRKGYVEGMTLFYGTFRPGVGEGFVSYPISFTGLRCTRRWS